MVSRVYTPLIPAYPRSSGPTGNFGAPSGTPAIEEDIRQAPGRYPPVRRPEEDTPRHPPPRAVQYDQTQKIPLADVIHDFRHTMSALSADEQTRAEVTAYLNVVRIQAAKEQPEVPFIKHTLKTAANSLDQFIGKALGQPSKVVKEWVDALLMQDIDYRSEIAAEDVRLDSPAESPSDPPASESPDAEETPSKVSDSISGGRSEIKARLKALIEDAQQEHRAGNRTEADQKLGNALELLREQDRPDWEGKIWHLRGRFYDQDGQWEPAVSAFRQAADCFKVAELPEKQAGALHAMADILDEHGRLDEAETTYRQVLTLDRERGDVRAQARCLNSLGSVLLRKQLPEPAIDALSQAAELMRNGAPPEARSDILSNLAAAYRQAGRYNEAVENYAQSLQAAKAARDRSRYVDTLQRMASVLVEANQPDRAILALRRLQAMGVQSAALPTT